MATCTLLLAAAHFSDGPSSASTASSPADCTNRLSVGCDRPTPRPSFPSKPQLFVHAGSTTANPPTRGLAQHDV
jgi:hypothetical protein